MPSFLQNDARKVERSNQKDEQLFFRNHERYGVERLGWWSMWNFRPYRRAQVRLYERQRPVREDFDKYQAGLSS